MKFLGIIPARYGSTRLEGKPLADINGKPMIQHVYERAQKALETVYVATDDKRIFKTVESFGGKVIMTSKNHSTGTNRCLEAYQKIQKISETQYNVVINIQGDEPLLAKENLTSLKKCFKDPQTKLATLITPVVRLDDLFNESEVFVTFNKNYFALYFSRSVIPHIRGVDKTKWLKKTTIYKHLGFYAYTIETLEEFASLPESGLEKMESLEQNRWLENGGKIKLGFTSHDSISVDTIDDLERVRKMMK